jgi:hypothetical protein
MIAPPVILPISQEFGFPDGRTPDAKWPSVAFSFQ